MNKFLEAAARWIDRADAGEVTAVIFTCFGGLAMALFALGAAIHGM